MMNRCFVLFFTLLVVSNSLLQSRIAIKQKLYSKSINENIFRTYGSAVSGTSSSSAGRVSKWNNIKNKVKGLKNGIHNKIQWVKEKIDKPKSWIESNIKKILPFVIIALFGILTKTNNMPLINPTEILPNILQHDFFIEIKDLWTGLAKSMHGAKLDSLILLIATSVIIPLFQMLDTSPILGFLITGTLLGPCGLNWVRDVHMIDILGELGIVFFLFEMGLELSLDKLMSMKRDVFGLGTLQFVCTSLAGMGISLLCGLSPPAAVTIGGSLALSSSAFVLQLLKDKEAMGTRYGRASFGILLLQDIAVVPLLVVVELLAKGGSGIVRALSIAGAKALITLTTMSFIGKRILDKIFYIVAKSGSHEAFLSSILASVLLMSFVTQGIGLSNTLGAFLAGLLLAETRYRYQIEADIAPFRGLLLGFFFLTVGFSIDLKLIIQDAPKILMLLFTLIAGKAGIITILCLVFGLSLDNAQQTGLLNAQAGEFAFVAFGMAERMGLLSVQLSRTLMTTVALSMALTPALAELGSFISTKLDRNQGYSHYIGDDSDAKEVKSSIQTSPYVFVCGYGRVGKMICDMLDRAMIPYIGVDSSPKKVIDARNRGLPIFYGDVSRPEIVRNFHPGTAKACVVAIGDMTSTNKAVVNLRRNYPDLPLLVRAKDRQHQARLQKMFDNIQVMCPVLPDDSVVLILPFGGAVLQTLGVKKVKADSIIEEFREQYLENIEGGTSSFTSKEYRTTTSSSSSSSSSSSKLNLKKDNNEEKDEDDDYVGLSSRIASEDSSVVVKNLSAADNE
eukprot:gene1869-3626_t